MKPHSKDNRSTRFQKHFQSWVSSRIPPGKIITLNQKNIFIMPTLEGLGLTLLLLLLLLTAINYQNSLIYLLTFFLGGIFVTSILACFRNLEGLTLAFIEGRNCFSGEKAHFLFKLSAQEGKRYHRLFLSNEPESYQWINIDNGSDQQVMLFTQTQCRGVEKSGRILIETRYPMGFLRAWSWLDLEAVALVYPSPVKGAKQLMVEGESDDSHGKSSSPGDDYSGVRDYIAGDPPNRMAWKLFASKGELYVKTFEANLYSTAWVDYDAYQGVNRESRLSYLCYELLEREKKGDSYGLKLPGKTIEFGRGDFHLAQCLSSLALFQSETSFKQAGHSF